MVSTAGKEVKTRCCAIPFPSSLPTAIEEIAEPMRGRIAWLAAGNTSVPDYFHGMALVMNSPKADKRPFTLSLSGRGNFRYVFPVLPSLAIIVAGNP